MLAHEMGAWHSELALHVLGLQHERLAQDSPVFAHGARLFAIMRGLEPCCTPVRPYADV
jgi:hypothetical protein